MPPRTWLTRTEAAERLGVSVSRLRSLARQHGGLGGRLDRHRRREYRADLVSKLVGQRSPELPESRLSRPSAIALLGIGPDRFNQLVRESPSRLGRRRVALGRSTYSRRAVESLKARREGRRAPAYPKRGSALSGEARGQQ